MKDHLVNLSGFLFVFILSVACENGPTRIYELKKFSQTISTDKGTHIDEVFIIANPPKSKDDLIQLVKSFNDSTLKREMLDEGIVGISRTFYRETGELNENFKVQNKGYFSKKDLSHYYKDKLLRCNWIVNPGRVSGLYFLYLEDGTESFETDHF